MYVVVFTTPDQQVTCIVDGGWADDMPTAKQWAEHILAKSCYDDFEIFWCCTSHEFTNDMKENENEVHELS